MTQKKVAVQNRTMQKNCFCPKQINPVVNALSENDNGICQGAFGMSKSKSKMICRKLYYFVCATSS